MLCHQTVCHMSRKIGKRYERYPIPSDCRTVCLQRAQVKADFRFCKPKTSVLRKNARSAPTFDRNTTFLLNHTSSRLGRSTWASYQRASIKGVERDILWQPPGEAGKSAAWGHASRSPLGTQYPGGFERGWFGVLYHGIVHGVAPKTEGSQGEASNKVYRTRKDDMVELG